MFLMELMKCVDELMMVGADGSGVRSKCVKVCELKEERGRGGGCEVYMEAGAGVTLPAD